MLTCFRNAEAKTATTNFTSSDFVISNSFAFPYFISNILDSVYICLVFIGFLQLIYFRMFCSKHSITFENMYLLSCWFHCVDIFYIKFRFCETYTVTSSVTRNLLIKTLSNFRTITSWYLDMYVLDQCKFKCYSA